MFAHDNINDLIIGADSPTTEFGYILEAKDKMIVEFNRIIEVAESRYNEMFNYNESEISIESLEKTIHMMWKQGWNPEKGNIDLFATDFGSILYRIITNQFGGILILRSDSNLDDLSLWWQESKIEFFPFRKIFRRLHFNEGDEDLISFVGLLENEIGKL